jgi:hypothetical protein
VQRSAWSFPAGMSVFSPSADGGRGKASIIVSSVRSSDADGKVESFGEKETFFFVRRIEEGERSFWGSGGGISPSVGESGPEEVEVAETWENTESTDERILDEIEELEWWVERLVACMRFGSAEKEAYST